MLFKDYLQSSQTVLFPEFLESVGWYSSYLPVLNNGLELVSCTKLFRYQISTYDDVINFRIYLHGTSPVDSEMMTAEKSGEDWSAKIWLFQELR